MNEEDHVHDLNEHEIILNDNNINLNNANDNVWHESNTNVDYERVSILDIYDPMN